MLTDNFLRRNNNECGIRKSNKKNYWYSVGFFVSAESEGFEPNVLSD